MAGKKKNAWKNSVSKGMLRVGMLQGQITEDTDLKQLYNHPEHQKWPYASWKKNLKTLLAAVERDRGRMQRDVLSYGNDISKVQAMRDQAALEAWHRSKAYRLLKEDVDAGLHEEKDPKDLWVTRDEYLAFDLDCFRKHIYQEVDSRSKRTIRFERKKKAWLYPELHKDHPRLLDDSSE